MKCLVCGEKSRWKNVEKWIMFQKENSIIMIKSQVEECPICGEMVMSGEQIDTFSKRMKEGLEGLINKKVIERFIEKIAK